MGEYTVPSLRLSDLRPGQRMQGLRGDGVATLRSVDLLDQDLADITFVDEHGNAHTRSLASHEIGNLRLLQDDDDQLTYDADPNDFVLAAEALRIKYTALYDPMAAVTSSDVDPLPHQIRAVYEELLPRSPLRFLLADDPGAGKTIMAGLYIKELILRSDCERALIVAPGGLVEQWRDELASKFELHFQLFEPEIAVQHPGKNIFNQHPYLIARMDQLARNEQLLSQLQGVNWDVVVVDEAHRMAARYESGEQVHETKRFKLGRILADTAHNFLLMTATPHAGKQQDFELFMSLLDRDRFEGRHREGIHKTTTHGLMRRMVKEDLLTFEGKPLFPERRAQTVAFELSTAEAELYDQVTEYVRDGMGRAERLMQEGDGQRGNNVGFALTVLQRRLASSTHAIQKSLERRRTRLESLLVELRQAEREGVDASPVALTRGLPAVDLMDDYDEALAEGEWEQYERLSEEVIDRATAAETIPELEAEIALLGQLVETARRVRAADQDAKWVELRQILDDEVLSRTVDGEPRKLIVFTEHRDTLDYLEAQIGSYLGGRSDVVTIHGGTRRDERKRIRERFTHDPATRVLLATDAAGEGLNLQRAHLMVNYDLPWNPNRLEQRFGRIHRIGQKQVCHLWNMVAKDTREGEVFIRLLSKIDSMDQAYQGKLFNVLGQGEAFQNRSLRDLMLEAIRYGDQPEHRAELDRVVDAGIATGLEDMMKEHALYADITSTLDVEAVRELMEAARTRRLQPGYVAQFFVRAFERLGGEIADREPGRFEITKVPLSLRNRAERVNPLAPVLSRYERATFSLELVRVPCSADAALIAPGHPLLTAVLDATIEQLEDSLQQGTVLVDRRPVQADVPQLMVGIEQRVTANNSEQTATVSHHFDYVLVSPGGELDVSPIPPYLDFDPPRPAELASVRSLVATAPALRDVDREVRLAARRAGIEPRIREISERRRLEADRVLDQVTQRLNAEINAADRRALELQVDAARDADAHSRRERALKRAQDLEARLERRRAELERAAELSALPAVFRARALVVPSKLIDPVAWAAETPGELTPAEVERRAVDAVLASERALGRVPVEHASNNPGYDITSRDPQGAAWFIEVKGCTAGNPHFNLTRNELAFAQTQGDRHLLALVEVSPLGSEYDELRYVASAFDHLVYTETTESFTESWQRYWERGAASFQHPIVEKGV